MIQKWELCSDFLAGKATELALNELFMIKVVEMKLTSSPSDISTALSVSCNSLAQQLFVI